MRKDNWCQRFAMRPETWYERRVREGFTRGKVEAEVCKTFLYGDRLHMYYPLSMCMCVPAIQVCACTFYTDIRVCVLYGYEGWSLRTERDDNEILRKR